MALTLTNERRDSIIRIAVKSTFTARREALEVENSSLAELAYSHLYPNDIQIKMNALPSEFFNQTSVVYAYRPGDNRDPIALALISSKKVKALDREYRHPAYYPETGSAIASRVIKLKADCDRLESDESTFKSELKRFLAGITTVKKLKEVWPEGQEFYAHLLADQPNKAALAIVPETINAMIGTMKEVK